MEQNVNEGISGLKVFSSKLDSSSHGEQSQSTHLDCISGTVTFASDVSHGCLNLSKHNYVSLVKTIKLSVAQ